MKSLLTSVRWLVLFVATAILNFPIIATLTTSFKSSAELSSNPGFWIEQPTFENFKTVLTISDRLNIYQFLANSMSSALIGTLLPIAFSIPAAYAIVRRNSGERWLLPLIINLRAMPLIIVAIPLYMVYQQAHLLDTRLGLGLILAIVNLPLTLMLMVNAVAEIPKELDEAAQMDGARIGRIIWKIIFPMCRPTLAAIFVFGFITAWNEFLFGLMLTTRSAVPMTVGASFFFASGGGGVDWGVAAGVIIVACLPPAVLGLLMYKQISSGLMAGAVKG